MRFSLLVLGLVALTACDLPALFFATETSKKIGAHFESSGRRAVNLSEAVPGPWDKVCVLGPYSGNNEAKATLGFEFDVESKTQIQVNEGISLFLFVRDGEVVEYIEHPRRLGDFTNLTMQCFPKLKAVFVQHQKPTKGWAGLFPENPTN